MDSYFGKIKTKSYVAPVYTYSSMKEYLEETISSMIQDIILLDNKVRSISKT
jgi:hypothetical protein